MRLRSLALFPLLYAAAFVAIALWLGGGEALRPFVSWQRILVRVLAAVGCFAAASGFGRGDNLRRAWLWLGTGTIFILLRDVLRLLPPFQPDVAGTGAKALLTALGVLSNLALLAGIWRLARSWRAIALPGGRLGAAAVGVASALLAVAVAGPGALASWRALTAGDLNALVLLVSAVVDILSLCLIAPLLLTAFALRGGLFSWPWALVTASQLSWLLYDAAAALVSPPGPAGFPLPDLFRGLAENFLFAGGLAQLLAVRHVRRAVESPAKPGPGGPDAVADALWADPREA